MTWPRTPHYGLLLPQDRAIGGAGDVTFETPDGVVNGVNTIFTLAGYPLAGTLQVYLAGSLLTEGVDYSVSGRTLTFDSGPAGPPSARYVRLGSYADILGRVVGPQIEDIAAANSCSLIVGPSLAVGAGGLASLSSADACDPGGWRGANLVASRGNPANARTRFTLAGIVDLAGNGTAGKASAPASDTTVAAMEGSSADDRIDGLNVRRHSVGFGIPGATLFDGSQPWRRLPHIRFGRANEGIDLIKSGPGLIYSGSVLASSDADIVWQFVVPADFGGWHQGAGEAANAVRAEVTCLGTVTAKLRLMDTTGAATAFGDPATSIVTLLASVAATGTFAVGRIAFACLRFSGGASGGNVTAKINPMARYERWARSNA